MDRRCATEGRRIRLRRQQPPARHAVRHQGQPTSTATAGRVDRQAQHGETVQVEPGRQRPVRGQRQDGRSGAGDHGRNARRPQRVDQSRRLRIGRPPVLLVQPVRGGGQQQVRAPVKARTASAVRLPVNAASASGTRVGQQPPRRRGGRLDAPGRARRERSPGARRPVQRRTGRPFPTRPTRSTNPPSRLAAALSACPSMPAVSCSNVSPLGGDVAAREHRGRGRARRRRRRPNCPGRARAGSRCGSAGAARRARRRTPSNARRMARTTRCRSSRGTPAPPPRRPRPSGRPRRRRPRPRRTAPAPARGCRTPARGWPTTPGTRTRTSGRAYPIGATADAADAASCCQSLASADAGVTAAPARPPRRPGRSAPPSAPAP